MTLASLAMLLATCLATSTCNPTLSTAGTVAGATTAAVTKTGEAVDVVLSAEAALAWDVTTNTILYTRAADTPRPIASLSKLLSVLLIRAKLSPDTVLTIPPEAATAAAKGADIRLPVGEHVTVQSLLSAGLIASANDALVTLAIGASGSEAAFVEAANTYATQHNLAHTKIANATGLTGGDQYSTAADIQKLANQVYGDPVLRPLLSQSQGALTTLEGTHRAYRSTNKLLGSYLPILFGKTGYTIEAGENLVIITEDSAGHRVGAIVLGSRDRFQDMKVLVEWIWRNYTWPQPLAS